MQPAKLKTRRHCRRGAATLDYVLLFTVVLPLVVFVMWAVPIMVRLVYGFTITIVGSPVM